uniref:DUF2782 domain-containing protein n=1 Tax=Candidatus Kentrum sp. FM TaxID=2126340 RepID=A0A450SKN7_9GAMM|nr:MAG: Protein of unknown function (DUF2782) [Candidatus Kentron sp. FM]VFJ56249.1 MAG: Protein of unknown function (DUF2782) [Candidatus Kentron sp. FM]VFK10158.1 MAG: Protein of unknown function (DUF2782) [Candidatus Kentron sp. FM]
MLQKKAPLRIVSFTYHFHIMSQRIVRNLRLSKLARAILDAVPMIAYGLLTLLFFSSLPAHSEDMGLQPVPEPPPLPARVESGELMEEDVTIIRGARHTLHEYRVNGRLYAIKIVPQNAPPYYMVDTDGDGILDLREEYRDDLISGFLIPQWVLFSW